MVGFNIICSNKLELEQTIDSNFLINLVDRLGARLERVLIINDIEVSRDLIGIIIFNI